MIRASLGFAITFSFFANAAPFQPWFGTWKVKEVVCPFGCPSWRDSKHAVPLIGKVFSFKEDKAITHSLECNDPSWTSVKGTAASDYLMTWSDNELAKLKPIIRKELPQRIGITPNTQIMAGVVQCKDGQAFNLIYVDAHKAFLLEEENAYIQLSR